MLLSCLGGSHQGERAAPQSAKIFSALTGDDAEAVAKVAAITECVASLIKDSPQNATILRQSYAFKTIPYIRILIYYTGDV